MFSDIFKKSATKKLFGFSDEELLKGENYGGVSLDGTPEDAYILIKKGFNNLFKYLTVYIREEKDFESLKSNFKSIPSKIIISKYILESKGIPPCKYNIEIFDINEFSMEHLIYLVNKGRELEKIYLRGFNCDFRYVFKINEFIQIKKSINSITRNIDVNKREIEKFLKVYEILGKNIEPTKYKDLYEAIYEKKASCHGYSELLNLALNNVGINSISIIGDYKKKNHPQHEGHAWNQVKIDGVWYNCDLTWDSQEMRKKRTVKYCLKGDKYFLHDDEHLPPQDDSIRYEVPNEYNQNIIQQYFSKDIDMER